MKYYIFTFIMFAGFSTLVNSNERQTCRKNLTVRAFVVECIEQGIYDPCDDSGGSQGRYQCAWAHVDVAERKIKTLVKEITTLFISWKLSDNKIKFIESEKKWAEYRSSYCESTDALAEYFISHSQEAILAMDVDKGFCYRRLTEKHAEELDFALSKIRE